MEKEFVTYEIAKSLKELDFNEPCLAFYNGRHLSLGVWDWEYPAGQKRIDIGECPQAPTFSQAFRWFRNKYNLLHSINGIHSTSPFELDCQILNILNGSSYQVSYSDNDYEEAELTCLEKLIEIVEQEKK